DRRAQSAVRGNNRRLGLRQSQFIEQPAEGGLAVRDAIIFERRQREACASLEPLGGTRKQKSLLVGRQQDVETVRGQQRLDESKIAARVIAQGRAAVKLPHESREARQAQGCGIADLDVMAAESQNRDRLAG